MARPKLTTSYKKLTLGVEEDVLKKAQALKKATRKSLSAMFSEHILETAKARSVPVDLTPDESAAFKAFCKANGITGLPDLLKLSAHEYVRKHSAKPRS